MTLLSRPFSHERCHLHVWRVLLDRLRKKRDCLLLDSKAHDSWPVRVGLYPWFFISQLISYPDFWWTKSNPSITDKLERAPQITRSRAKDSRKIFEKHIYDSLNTHLSRNNLLYGLQLVFEKNHSTETALIWTYLVLCALIIVKPWLDKSRTSHS